MLALTTLAARLFRCPPSAARAPIRAFAPTSPRAFEHSLHPRRSVTSWATLTASVCRRAGSLRADSTPEASVLADLLALADGRGTTLQSPRRHRARCQRDDLHLRVSVLIFSVAAMPSITCISSPHTTSFSRSRAMFTALFAFRGSPSPRLMVQPTYMWPVGAHAGSSSIRPLSSLGAFLDFSPQYLFSEVFGTIVLRLMPAPALGRYFLWW